MERRGWAAATAVAATAVTIPVAYLALFTHIPPLFEDKIFATRSAAIEQALDDSAAVEWPGTTSVEVERGDMVRVERRWLGMWETRVDVEMTGARWRVRQAIQTGPARIVQKILALVIAPLVVGLLVYRFVDGRRRRVTTRRDADPRGGGLAS